VGALLIGFIATTAVNDGGADGLFAGGGVSLLGKQALAVVATIVYSFVVTFVIGKIIDLVMGFRASAEDEATGLDSTTHAETAYDFGTIRAGGSGTAVAAASAAEDAAKSGGATKAEAGSDGAAESDGAAKSEGATKKA